MQIKIGNTVLCHGQTRNSTGDPVGPRNLRMSEQPGVAVREPVGADRSYPERVRCNKGSLSFDVTRVYGSVQAALAYALSGHLSEEVEGALTSGSTTIFAHAAVTTRVISHQGCAVSVSYTIEG